MSEGKHVDGGRDAVRHPGEDVLWKEIEQDRLGERWLILKSIVALAFVGVLVVIRTLYFT